MANLGPLRGRADSKPRRSLVWAFVLPVFDLGRPGLAQINSCLSPPCPKGLFIPRQQNGAPTKNPRPVVLVYWGPTERRELCAEQGARTPGSAGTSALSLSFFVKKSQGSCRFLVFKRA